jgi:hypothetical protein
MQANAVVDAADLSYELGQPDVAETLAQGLRLS